ncbi:MAG TPA: hypothetical protein VLF39_00785 [Candidatus Saccharimonadales bacterium]|nr:hypothetical protein [Candidatus Saccharimonadales bacterium]
MAKKSLTIKTLREAQRVILATTSLLVTGLVIIFIGWVIEGNAGQLLIGFGSAMLLISAILYWGEIHK